MVTVYSTKCAPTDGLEAKICGVMPVDFSYSADSVAAMSAALRNSQSVTVDPPKLPPVMRANHAAAAANLACDLHHGVEFAARYLEVIAHQSLVTQFPSAARWRKSVWP